MSNLCKITLSPLGWYFFGGETTFGEGDSNNYFAKSNLLPQETALLGMLRYELLKAENLLPINSDNQEAANRLIGERSFSYSKGREDLAPFGAIKTISPLFLQYREEEILYKTPVNHRFDVAFQESGESSANICFTNRCAKKQIPLVKNFLGKVYDTSYWISLKDGAEHREFYDPETKKGIFRQRTKIGITKRASEEAQEANKKEKEKGFFKTTQYTLSPEYSFVFFASVDSEKLKGERSVFLGAERSVFNMKVETSSETIETLKQKLCLAEEQLLFISDAFVDSEVLSHCRFAWAETQPFRNLIRTNAAGKNYARLDRKEKSGRFNLIRRGSVLFFDEKQLPDILSHIDDSYLQRFGYNQYVINVKHTK